jgi:RNA ligase
MFYDFPQGLTLEETRAVIRAHNARVGTDCFIEADRGCHVIFNYVVSFDGSFPQPDPEGDLALNREYAILRECRGLVFETTYGMPIARRYHKFFNVNEKSFTQAHLIDWSQPHVVLEKLDGSMIAPFPHTGRPGGVAWGTKMGFTDVSRPVEAFVAARPEYARLFWSAYDSGFTPIFEWCSRQQKIVVDYPEERLVLTALRSLNDGRYLDHVELQRVADTHGVPVVGIIADSPHEIADLIATARALEGEEGYIIRFDNGHMLKIKGEWYVQVHRTKDLLNLEKDVWALILGDTLDDAKALMDPDDRARVERFETDLLAAVVNKAEFLSLFVECAKAVGDDKRSFAASIAAHPDRGLLFAMWDGKNPVEVVKDFLRKNCNTGPKIDSIRAYVNGIRWEDYRDTYSVE